MQVETTLFVIDKHFLHFSVIAQRWRKRVNDCVDVKLAGRARDASVKVWCLSA